MFEKNTRLILKTTLGLFTIMFALAYLTACLSKENRIPEEEGPDISYPGLSVYGLGGVPPAEIATPWSSSICFFRQNDQTSTSFVVVSGGRTTRADDSVQQHIDYRLAATPLDSCHIITEGDGHSKACFHESKNLVNFDSNLTINRPGQSPLVIQPTRKLGAKNSYLTGVLPTGASLSLSLTSDTFPNIETFNLLDSITPENFTPNLNTWVNPDTKYTWKPSIDPSSYIEISFYSRGPKSWPDGHGLRCDVVDDGEFELPKETLELVRKYENSLKVGYSRVTRRMDYQNGVLLYQAARARGDVSGVRN